LRITDGSKPKSLPSPAEKAKEQPKTSLPQHRLSLSTARPWRLERQLPRMPPGQPAANRGNLHQVRTPRPRSELRLLQAPAMEELIPAPVAPCRQPRLHKRVRAGELPPAARSSSMPVAAPATRRPPEQLRADSSIDGAPAAGQAQARQGFGSRRETTERGRIFELRRRREDAFLSCLSPSTQNASFLCLLCWRPVFHCV